MDNIELATLVFETLSDGYDDEEEREDCIEELLAELELSDKHNKYLKLALQHLCERIEELTE